jgi:hypothetical protein
LTLIVTVRPTSTGALAVLPDLVNDLSERITRGFVGEEIDSKRVLGADGFPYPIRPDRALVDTPCSPVIVGARFPEMLLKEGQRRRPQVESGLDLERLNPERRIGAEPPVAASNRNCMMALGPGLSRGCSSTLSCSRAMCGTKAKRFEGSVEIACAPIAVSCRSIGCAPIVPSPSTGMHRQQSALVIGGEQIFAGAVRREKGGCVLR